MRRTRTRKKAQGFTRHGWIRLPLILLGIGLAVGLAWAGIAGWKGGTAPVVASAGAPADTGWAVGMRRPNGLRIIPSGRSDASQVLDLDRFTGQTRHAYWVATQIPAVLNQLYCWCGCENSGVHRSNLACFEDRMGEGCDVCQGTAEIAYEMTRRGVTDAGQIQAAVDAKWGPAGA